MLVRFTYDVVSSRRHKIEFIDDGKEIITIKEQDREIKQSLFFGYIHNILTYSDEFSIKIDILGKLYVTFCYMSNYFLLAKLTNYKGQIKEFLFCHFVRYALKTTEHKLSMDCSLFLKYFPTEEKDCFHRVFILGIERFIEDLLQQCNKLQSINWRSILQTAADV